MTVSFWFLRGCCQRPISERFITGSSKYLPNPKFSFHPIQINDDFNAVLNYLFHESLKNNKYQERMMGWKFKFELDKYELEDLKLILEKLKKKEPKTEISINGDVRKLAQNMLKAILDQEEFYKDERW